MSSEILACIFDPVGCMTLILVKLGLVSLPWAAGAHHGTLQIREMKTWAEVEGQVRPGRDVIPI